MKTLCLYVCIYHCCCYTLLVLCYVCGLLRLENNLSVQVELPPGDLGPTGLLNKSLQLLQEILSSHDSSSVTPEERKQAVAQVKIVCRSCANDLLNTSCIKDLLFAVPIVVLELWYTSAAFVIDTAFFKFYFLCLVFYFL